MKKIIVNKICQKNIVFYSMIADPRLIAKIRRKYTAGEQQDVQRPWIPKKVEEISEYVDGKAEIETKKSLGIIPNTPILNIKKDLRVQKERITVIENGIKTDRDQYYVLLPETDDEISKYENQLEIIDGQHRIIAFDTNYIAPSLTDSTVYEMNFSLFDNLSDNERKEIFMVTNDKQKPVEQNLLRYIKRSLGLLKDEDIERYDLLYAINQESSSPLYHRIVFGSDNTIKKGYKEAQLSKIFANYGVQKFYDASVIPSYATPEEAREAFIKILSNYLEAWEEASNVSFHDPASDTITKISGLRYLLCIFPEICNKLMNSHEKLYKENFLKVINIFPDALELENVKCIFCDDSAVDADTESLMERSLAFRGEGATIALAKKDIQKVITYDNNREIGGLL